MPVGTAQSPLAFKNFVVSPLVVLMPKSASTPASCPEISVHATDADEGKRVPSMYATGKLLLYIPDQFVVTEPVYPLASQPRDKYAVNSPDASARSILESI